jgi:hypothetical protein
LNLLQGESELNRGTEELTMRDGNPAAKIYRRCGFSRVPHCATFAAAGQTLAEFAQQFADATATTVGM